MRLESLCLTDFRNYVRGSFEFAPGVNVIIGENGRGKTNILEAVYMLSGSRSWRGAKTGDLMRFGSSVARIGACAESRGRSFVFDINLSLKTRAKITVNDVPVRKKQAMSDIIRCVLFSPEDLFLIKGAAGTRRDLMDDCLCQSLPVYGEVISRYETVLKHKQKLLRDGEDMRVLPELNYQLAYYGRDIVFYRHKLIEDIKNTAADIHRSISGGKEELGVFYTTMSCITDCRDREQTGREILDHLKALESAEIASNSCLSGVHRDDIDVYINGREARRFASQGQSRTAAIALKFAQRELLRDGEDYPLLLLDDVLSELDEVRQSYILKNTRQGQTIITCCQMPESISQANFMYIPDEFIAGESE